MPACVRLQVKIQLNSIYQQSVSVRDLIREILVELPGLEAELLTNQGELAPHVNFLVNGRNVRYLDGGCDNLLADGDQVSIFPAIAGG